MMMKITQTITVLALSSVLFTASAEQSESLLNFKFNHSSTFAQSEELFPQNTFSNSQSVEFSQLDATWTYPWETSSMNFDLGVTLRHLSGYKNSNETMGTNHFQEVLPLLHASALFNFPLKGLSAGIEGSHLEQGDRQVLDYRAKVSYEWRKGFGLQGGWQHQKFNLDSSVDSDTGFEKTGPFIDFYLNF
jgi:outer membrane protein